MQKGLAMIGVVAMIATMALAQAPDDNSAPPASNALVARLSAISGTVSTSSGDSGAWSTGALNTPLVTGDKVAAGEGARAEVQLDYADLLRLGSNSQANLTELNNDQIQVQIAAGLADYVVLKDARASAEIDTPNVAIRPTKAGVYRINVVSDNETDVIVRKGEADISTPQGSTVLKSGQLMTVQGVDNPEYQITDAPSEDAWDRWNKDRDHRIESAASFRYTNPYYTGVQSLDGYGYWTMVPGYGEVWVPNENAAWSPYSDGRWVFEPGWGWTWVGYEPWGWAPYHYGRWMMYDAQWAWWPGPVTPYYRPMWAPAYVSFFGWGGGFGVGVGFGSVGWMPIGPCDPFRPWWGGRGRTTINITNVTVINNYRGGDVIAPLAVGSRYRTRYSNLDMVTTNARVRAAVIRVPANEFGRGAINAREHVSVNEMRNGSVIGGRLGVTPERGSMMVGRPMAHSAVESRPVANRFYAVHTAPAARPGMGRPGMDAAAGRANSHFSTEGRVNAPAARSPEARPADNGFRRFGGAAEPAPRNVAPPQERGARPQAQPDRGFQRFGRPQAPAQSQPQQTRPEARPEMRPPDQGFQRFGGQQARPDARPESRPAPRAYAPPERGPQESARPPLPVGHRIVEQPRPQYRPQPQYQPQPQPRPEMRAPQYNPGPSSRPGPAPEARGQGRDARGR